MAQVRNNIAMHGLSGSLGPDHYARITRDGRTIISHKPNFGNRQFSEAQLNVQKRTKQAAAYAKVASREKPIYARKAAGTSQNAYNIAFRDWQRPPVIERIEWRDGRVRVNARDDVIVTGVTVSMLGEDGMPLERGAAEPSRGFWWDYEAAHRGRILVEARDLAGNVTRQEFSPSSGSLSFWEKTSSR